MLKIDCCRGQCSTPRTSRGSPQRRPRRCWCCATSSPPTRVSERESHHSLLSLPMEGSSHFVIQYTGGWTWRHDDIMTIWHYDNMSWTSMEILHVMESPSCLAQRPSGPPLCLIVCRPTWWQTKWWPHRLTSHFCRVMLTSSPWLVLGSERKDIPPSYCPIYLFCFLKPSGYAFSTSKTRENAIFP